MSTAQLAPPTATPKTPTATSAAPALVQAKGAGSFFGPPVVEAPFFAPVRPVGVQAKFTIGRADDAFEREADATADRIVAMPAPAGRAAIPAATPPAIQRKTEEEKDKKLRRKGGETATPAPTAAFEAGLAASQSGGQPLAAEARQYMEPRFGADFSGVRVHTDAPAVQLTQSIGAQAFAYQNHVYFNSGKYDPGSSGGRHLLAHELTHVVQQGSVVQRQPLAESAAAPLVSRATPTVQRLFGVDVAGTIDGWLGAVPGWRLLTTLIGYNPVTQRTVARSTTNLLEGFLTLGGPLGLLLFRRLQAEGIIERAAGWMDAQVAALGLSLSYVRGLFSQAWDEMGITLGISGNIAVIQRVFGPAVSRMIAFGGRLISQVVAWLKETILRPLSARARTFRGFPLLTVIIGKDPFTDEVVERSPTNLVRGFMLLMDGGEERFQQMQQSGALAKAFAWFNTETTKRNLTWTRIKGVFLAAWNLLTPEAVLHPIETVTSIAGLFLGLAADVVSFAGAALLQMLELIFEAVMGAGGARVLAILKRGRDTFNVIIRNPVAFVGNLVRAGRQGFQQFMAKGLQYLQQGVVGWLLGALTGAGLQLPARFDLRGVLSLVLQVLGLTYQNIRSKLVRATSEAFVARLEQVFDFLRLLVTQGPAAAWQKILEYVGNLRDMVLDGIKAWVMRTVVGQAVVRVLSMLNPAGAVIQAILATYNTVMFFVERINQIAAVVEAYVDSIAAIAAGNIGAAANRVEQTMGRMVPVIISFLARLLGLGGISDTIRNLIARVRQPVDRALDRVVDWVVAQGRRLVGAVVGAGVPQDPNERLRLGMEAAAGVVNRLSGSRVGRAIITPLLVPIRIRYGFQELEPVVIQNRWNLRGRVNPSMTVITTKEDGSEENLRIAVGDVIKARYVDGMWVATVTAITRANVTYRFSDPRKGTDTVSRSIFADSFAAGDITTYVADRRGTFLGGNPPKQTLLDRYIAEGRYYRRAGTPRTDQVMFPRNVSRGAWYNVSDCDLSHHPVDAVTYWNTTGYLYGPRSAEVRDWMTDIRNYIFEPSSLNRSRGSRNNETYRLPAKA